MRHDKDPQVEVNENQDASSEKPVKRPKSRAKKVVDPDLSQVEIEQLPVKELVGTDGSSLEQELVDVDLIAPELQTDEVESSLSETPVPSPRKTRLRKSSKVEDVALAAEADTESDVEMVIEDGTGQVVDPEPEAKKSPRRGFFAWLGGLFKTKKTEVVDLSEPELSDVPTLVVPEGLTESDLELSPAEIKKELAKQRRETRELSDSRERLESEVAARSEQMVVYAEQVDHITAWANQVSRTFIWKVQEEMDRNLGAAKSDMAVHEAAVKDLKVIEPGRLLELRKRFHKSLTWALVVCGVLIGAVSIIRFREEIPRLDWLSVLYDPNISGPILIVTLALIVGLVVLLSRKSKSDAPKLARIIGPSLLSILVGVIIWDSSRENSFMQTAVNPFIDRHYTEIVTALGSIWTLWVIASLITYYRDYSIFNRDVEKQILALEGVIEGYVKTQQEISRLSLLYRQTNDWLEILANALYRPWKTHPEWGTSKEFTNHYDTFPFALRVAQAREGADARMQELERIIGSRLLTQGWRNDAFEDLVAQVGIEMGLPQGKFVVDLLDNDLPHQTNNSRSLLKRFLTHSAKTSYSGEVDLGMNSAPPQVGKPEPTDRYLVEVARKRLLDLIEKTQSVAISAARPRVEQIVDDPLLSLRADSAGVDDFDPTESWDEFLTDSLGADSVDESPLGVLSFTEEGRMKNLPSKVQSFVLVPKRLEKSLPNISSDRISVVPLGDDRPRSLEIIARIDVVGPADLGSVALLGASAQQKIQQGAKKSAAMEIEEEL
jgi:hypothetical protein